MRWIISAASVTGLDEDTEKELRSCISGKNFSLPGITGAEADPEPYHSILLKLADMFENIESLEAAKALVKMRDPAGDCKTGKVKRAFRAVRRC